MIETRTKSGTRSTPVLKYLDTAVYGLTELHRDEVRQAKIVANPGCYPTGAILGLAAGPGGGSDCAHLP